MGGILKKICNAFALHILIFSIFADTIVLHILLHSEQMLMGRICNTIAVGRRQRKARQDDRGVNLRALY